MLVKLISEYFQRYSKIFHLMALKRSSHEPLNSNSKRARGNDVQLMKVIYNTVISLIDDMYYFIRYAFIFAFCAVGIILVATACYYYVVFWMYISLLLSKNDNIAQIFAVCLVFGIPMIAFWIIHRFLIEYHKLADLP